MNAVAAAYLVIYKHEEMQRLAEANHSPYIDEEPDFMQPEEPKKNIVQRVAQVMHRQEAPQGC